MVDINNILVLGQKKRKRKLSPQWAISKGSKMVLYRHTYINMYIYVYIYIIFMYTYRYIDGATGFLSSLPEFLSLAVL